MTPVEPTFAPLIGIIAMFEGDGAKLPAAFLSNEANHGTAMMVVLARILCLSVGITFGSSASVEQSAWAPRSPFALDDRSYRPRLTVGYGVTIGMFASGRSNSRSSRTSS